MSEDLYVQRRVWSDEEKQSIVAEAFRSNKPGEHSVKRVARTHGVQPYQIYRWRSVLSKSKMVPALVPVRVSPDTRASGLGPTRDRLTEVVITADLGNGAQVRIHSSASVAIITAALRALS